MSRLPALLLPLLACLLSPLVSATPPDTDSGCTSDFYALEKELLSRSGNRYNLTKAFFPPRDASPVVVKVTYVYEGSEGEEGDVWFWTESLFYLVQPLEIFQYTSLFFSNLPYRQKEVTVTLGANCSQTDPEYLMILTQRIKLYSQSATTSPTAATQRLNQEYFAVAASLEEIQHDQVISDFIKVWLHITLVLFPLTTWLMLYLCDPVHLLLGEQTWQKLEDEHTHGTISALIQISVMFTTYVFILDWIAFGTTIASDLLSYDTHPTFYLTTITGMLVDIGAFIWVVCVISFSCCHGNCYSFWKIDWRHHPDSEQLLKKSTRIKKLMSSIMVAPVLCFSNHLYYIILAFMSDPFHAGSILIAHGISFFLHYFIFRQFYNTIVLKAHHRKSPQEKEKLSVNIISASNPDVSRSRNNSTSAGEANAKRPKIRRKILRVPFNTQVVVYGLFIIGPILVLYEAIIIVLFATLPITKLTEDAPSRLYGLYQGTGILIVVLLSYNIVLRPSPFSFTKTIEKMAKELRISKHYPKWYQFSNEEKVANVCVYLLRHKPIPSPATSELDLRMRQQLIDAGGRTEDSDSHESEEVFKLQENDIVKTTSV